MGSAVPPRLATAPRRRLDRKHRDPWTGRLPGRLIGSRFLIAKMVTSFYGREDAELEGELIAELPAILRWALAGLDRLKKNAKFTESDAARGPPGYGRGGEPCRPVRGRGLRTWPAHRAGATCSTSRGTCGASPIRTFGRQQRAVYSDICDSRPRAGGVRQRHVWNELGLRGSFVRRIQTSERASGDSFENSVRAAECAVPNP